MAIRYLKTGKPQQERSDDDARVRAVVESALAEIEARGDAAVRELAEKFDNFSPASYRLSQEEIDELISQVSPRDMDDIRFAQDQ
ncbi:MAG: histidinol dehydrogenase, partial [Rhodobiaceae bacterium]